MPKQLPTLDRTYFVLCDDIRPEPNSKFTMLGVMTASEMLVAQPALPTLFSSLAALVIFHDGEGTFNVRTRIKTESGKVIFDEPMSDVTIIRGQVANVMTVFKPFVVTEWGKYTLEILLDGTSYAYTWAINVGQGNTNPPNMVMRSGQYHP